MTRDESVARIDALGSETDQQLEQGLVEDARKLLGMLPDRALVRMSESWIRRQPDEPGVIEFFWSRSFNPLNPGNRITTIRTRGDGRFDVAVRTSSTETFDAANWQRAENGEPLAGELSLHADALNHWLMRWWIGKSARPMTPHM